MPYADAVHRREYERHRDRRAYDKWRYRTNPERRAKNIAAAKAQHASLMRTTTPQQRTARMRHFPSRSFVARRREHLRRRYRLTVEQWNARFDAQGSRCAICSATESGWKRGWHTDHDHGSGEVRGILCHLCNRTLGQLKDDPMRFQAFIDYLRGKPHPRP
jgi:Recombination endonuclease VII